MARTKGTLNLSGTLEVKAGGPLDARSLVPTLADLTTAANFPYPYVGMETYVVSENKKYRLVATPVTSFSNWKEVGSGAVPDGGTIGQVLAKKSDADGDVDWKNEQDISVKSDLSNIAELFNPLETYKYDDYCIYDGLFYKCLVSHTGSWDPSHFSRLSIGDELSYIDSKIEPQLVSWSTGTNEQIKAMIDAYYAGIFTLAQIQSVWSVGDVRNVSISAIPATGTNYTVQESHPAQTLQIEIIDFDHDLLTTPVGTKNKALITVDMKNSFNTGSSGDGNTENGRLLKASGSNNDYRTCQRRLWCNEGFFNALPYYIKSSIRQVIKEVVENGASSTVVTIDDYVFLLSEKELWGTSVKARGDEGTQYYYYTLANTNKNKLPVWANGFGSQTYWLRSPSTTGETCNYYCPSNTPTRDASYDNPIGIIVAWCM